MNKDFQDVQIMIAVNKLFKSDKQVLSETLKKLQKSLCAH
jgi:hypothetical protein